MLRHRRMLAVVGAVVVLVGASAGRATAATANVGVADNVFQPAQITVMAGDTIVWTQTGQRPHTVTADDGSFDSGNMSNGQTFSRTIDTPGRIPYYCKLHGGPGGVGMAGVIVVEAAQATTTTAPATTTTAPATTTTAAPTTTTGAARTAAQTTTAPTQRAAGTTAERQRTEPLANTGLPVGVLAAIGTTLVVAGGVAVRRTRRPAG